MFSTQRLSKSFAFSACALLLPSMAHCEDAKVNLHGAAWLQIGRVERSYTVPTHEGNNYMKNWMQNAGGLVAADVKMNDNWDAAAGIGVIQVHLARGNRYHSNILYPFWVPFVSEARVSYASPLFSAEDKFKLTLGAFPYNYNNDAKSLGLYLMHGYVYPGALVSGFGSLFGGLASYETGRFSNDFIVNIESEDQPLYDISIADVVNVKVAPGFEVGAGVNFYRLIPQNANLTSPGKDCVVDKDLGFYATKCFEVDSIGVDATGNAVYDTVTGTLAGTKLMTRFRVDPKAWMGSAGKLGKDDLVLYGEAAVIGVKNQGKSYDDILRRLPVMVGFNFPVFGYLDNLSLEVEYYASKNSSDNLEAMYGSWVPVDDKESDLARDDWKWALCAGKLIAGNMKWTVQVANDHLRLGGFHDEQTGVEVTTTPNDWYWTTKLAYFF